MSWKKIGGIDRSSIQQSVHTPVFTSSGNVNLNNLLANNITAIDTLTIGGLTLSDTDSLALDRLSIYGNFKQYGDTLHIVYKDSLPPSLITNINDVSKTETVLTSVKRSALQHSSGDILSINKHNANVTMNGDSYKSYYTGGVKIYGNSTLDGKIIDIIGNSITNSTHDSQVSIKGKTIQMIGYGLSNTAARNDNILIKSRDIKIQNDTVGVSNNFIDISGNNIDISGNNINFITNSGNSATTPTINFTGAVKMLGDLDVQGTLSGTTNITATQNFKAGAIYYSRSDTSSINTLKVGVTNTSTGNTGAYAAADTPYLTVDEASAFYKTIYLRNTRGAFGTTTTTYKHSGIEKTGTASGIGDLLIWNGNGTGNTDSDIHIRSNNIHFSTINTAILDKNGSTATKMLIHSNGNVGVGSSVTTPAKLLSIGYNNSGFSTGTSNDLIFSSKGLTTFTADIGGYFIADKGIGTDITYNGVAVPSTINETNTGLGTPNANSNRIHMGFATSGGIQLLDPTKTTYIGGRNAPTGARIFGTSGYSSKGGIRMELVKPYDTDTIGDASAQRYAGIGTTAFDLTQESDHTKLALGNGTANVKINIPAQTTTDTNGTDLHINAGAKNGTGTNGIVYIGNTNTSKVLISNAELSGDITVGSLITGSGSANGEVKSNGNRDLILKTGNATTGSITIANGANGAITLAPNGTGTVTVTGNLTVDGTTTTVNSTNTLVADRLLELANGTTGNPTADSGIIIERGSDPNVFMGWDESENKFTMGTSTSATGASTTVGDFTAGTLVVGTLEGTVGTAVQGSITSVGTLTGLTVNGNVSVSDGSNDFDIASHDGTNGLKLAGTLVTSSATELNIMDGNSTINSITAASGHGVVYNDSGTMKQVDIDNLKTYIQSGSAASTRLSLDEHISITNAYADGQIFHIDETIIADSGTITSKNFHVAKVEQVTIKNTNASSQTYDSGASLYIANAPAVLNNAAITNNYALHVAAGASKFGGAVDVNSLKIGGTAVTASAAELNIIAGSKTQKYVYAAPTSADGAATFRALVASDIPILNQNQNTSGTAAKATILETTRTIGGVSFNGSSAINLPGVNTDGNQNTTGSAATVTSASQPNITTLAALTAAGATGVTTTFSGPISVSEGVTGNVSGSSGSCTGNAASVTNGVYTSGTQTIGGAKTFTSVTVGVTPTLDSHLATKSYVDGVAEGLDVKDSVVMATTAALDYTYDNGSSGVGATLTRTAGNGAVTIDGIATATVNQRVLVKNQAATAQNGIYYVSTASGGGATLVLTRATDSDTAVEFNSGAFTFVEQGTTNADTGWTMTQNASITFGTTSITWTQFSDAGQVTAGAGLTKTGAALSVNAAQTQIISVGALATGSIASGFGTISTGSTITSTAAITGGSLITGSGSANGQVKSNGDHDLILKTGNTTTGSITIADGANGAITLAPNGTGAVDVSGKLTTTGSTIILSDGTSYDAHKISGGAITESATGTHPLITGLHVSKPTITGAAAATTDAATLYIDDAPANATNNYALLVAAGASKFAGSVDVNSLKIGTTAVTASAAELNILNGSTGTAGTTAVADDHGILMKQGNATTLTTVQTLAAYLDDEITAMPNLVTTAATTVGALASGSIASGFGTISTGSTITSTAAVTGGSLITGSGSANGEVKSNGDHDLILKTGNAITGSITIVDGANGAITLAPNGTGAVDVSGKLTTTGATLTLSDNTSYDAHKISGGIITESGSGTHPLITGLHLSKPTITGAVATTTDAATLYIDDAPANATNNYALLVAAGDSKFGGAVSGPTATSGTNTTQLATTAFVAGAVTAGGSSIDLTQDITVNELTVGKGASNKSANTAFGKNALNANTSGNYNVANGYEALTTNQTGNYNVATGASALNANTSGESNVGIGVSALNANTSGECNVATGSNALAFNSTGHFNTGIGRLAGKNNTTASYNTFLGALTDLDSSGAAWTKSTALGYNAKITASNQIMLGTSTETVVVPNNLTIGANIVGNAGTNGTKIGTATNQKLGFFNATPVVQQSNIAGASSTQGAANGNTPTRAEFDGLRTDVQNLTTKLNAILTALEALGLLANA